MNQNSAPRVQMDDILANIVSEHYFTAAQGVSGAESADQAIALIHGIPPLGLLTFCVLVLKNGFTVTGESACVSGINFDAVIGQKIAKEHAIAKLWPLMGYAMAQSIQDAKNSSFLNMEII